MHLLTPISQFQPIAVTLMMFVAVIGGYDQLIRPALLCTSLTGLVLGYSLGRWPAPDRPRWGLWPMARTWLVLLTLSLLPWLMGYSAPARGTAALCALSLVPAEIARWAGGYSSAMRRLQGL